MQNRRTALVTGANSGVGYELTKKLLTENWDIIALIRSDFPENDLIIKDALKNKSLRIYKADISDFKSLRLALNKIKTAEHRIDVLFNNAGVGIGELKYSPQSRELHYEVNTVVPYIIAMEMKELVKNGIDKTIINTSSNALLTVKEFDLQTLEKPKYFKKLFGSYALSKLALSLWTKEVSESMKAEGIEIRSVCPGGNKTAMTASTGMPFLLQVFARFAFSHPSIGAKTVYNAFANFKGVTGSFINKGKAIPFKFSEMSKTILAKVDSIYKQEFLSRE